MKQADVSATQQGIIPSTSKEGKHVADTIEWLETIGTNAKLRHAPAEELAHTLAQADASNALKAAVMSGDRSQLSAEFDHEPLRVNHGTTGPAHEEEPDDDDGRPTPALPLKPDQDKSSQDR